MTTIDAAQAPFAYSLREQWRTQTVDSVWLRPGDWYHPAVDAVTETVSAGLPVDAAAYRLGEVRGKAGVGIAEALDDLAVVFRLVGTQPGIGVVRSLCEGWAEAVEGLTVNARYLDPESGLPTADYLSVRLAETYGAARKHAHHAYTTHCLVLIDVATDEVEPWERMARSAAMGKALAATMPSGHPMAALGGGAFAVLVARDFELGETVRRMREQVNAHALALGIADILRQPPRIWVEPLPEAHERAADLLDHLRRA